MDQEEIEVLELPVSELLLDELGDVLLGVEGVPELGSDDCGRRGRTSERSVKSGESLLQCRAHRVPLA